MSIIHIFDEESDPFIYLAGSVSLTGFPLADIDLTAEEYLQYATRDLEDGTGRGAMNALGNAKRALHLTVDSLLNAYGLLAQNRKLGFPQKLELMDAAGLFSLSILNTLNLERNVMEHEYRVPSHARVQEMIDVGRLLLLATRRMGEYVAYECLAGWRADQAHGIVQLNPALGLMSFVKVTGPSHVIEYEGTELTLLESIRTADGSLVSGVEVEACPAWTVSLGYRNIDEWRPLFIPLAGITDARYGIESAVVYDDKIELSMRVTLPRDQSKLLEGIMTGRGLRVMNFAAFTFGFEASSAEPE